MAFALDLFVILVHLSLTFDMEFFSSPDSYWGNSWNKWSPHWFTALILPRHVSTSSSNSCAKKKKSFNSNSILMDLQKTTVTYLLITIWICVLSNVYNWRKKWKGQESVKRTWRSIPKTSLLDLNYSYSCFEQRGEQNETHTHYPLCTTQVTCKDSRLTAASCLPRER